MLLNITSAPETTNEYGFKLLTFLLRYNNILKKEQWHSGNNYKFCYVINIKTLKCFFRENSIYKLRITWKNIFGVFIIGTYCITVGGHMIKHV